MFKKACSIAETMEMADWNTQEFHPSSSETIQVNKVMEQESENTERLLCPSCGGSHSVPSKLKAMMSAKMMMNWAFILCFFFYQNIPNCNGYTLKLEINDKPCMMELDTPADF